MVKTIEHSLSTPLTRERLRGAASRHVDVGLADELTVGLARTDVAMARSSPSRPDGSLLWVS
jgi:hypothetical protein